jgi:hypothetical protein
MGFGLSVVSENGPMLVEPGARINTMGTILGNIWWKKKGLRILSSALG